MPISISNLSVQFKECFLIRDITLNIGEKGITAVLGPNGSGKSTLLASICGLRSYQAKKLDVDGLDLLNCSGREKAKLISFMPQKVDVAPELLVEDFFHYSRYPQMDTFRPLLSSEISLRDKICAQLKISHLLGRKISQVSGGELKKIAIASAFFHGGRYIFLDEPFQALDPVVKVEVANFLHEAVSEYNCTIVMACHDLFWVEELCKEVIFMKSGSLLHHGKVKELMTEDHMQELYGGGFVRYHSDAHSPSRGILGPKGIIE